MRDVLAFAENYATWTQSMRYATELTQRLDGALTGLYVVEPIVPMPSSIAMPELPMVYAYTRELIEQGRAAEAKFLQEAAKHGATDAQWVVMEGDFAPALCWVANRHDVVVLGSGTGSGWTAPGPLGQALLACDKATIVVPQSYTRAAALETIAVAWNASGEAMRAIHDALPLLRRATRVVLFQGERKETFSPIASLPAFGIESWLSHRGVRCESTPFSADSHQAGEALLRAAHGAHADLIVMGAYGHTRIGEWALGGATRHMLTHGDLPVLFRH